MARRGLFLALAAVVTIVINSRNAYAKVPGCPSGSYKAGDTIEAECFDDAYAVQVSNDCTGTSGYYMGTIYPSGWLRYNKVDFGTTPAEFLTIQVASLKPLNLGGQIIIRKDGIGGDIIATVQIQTVGPTWCNFIKVKTFLSAYTTGTSDLYLTFNSADDQTFVNIDWFKFNVPEVV